MIVQNSGHDGLADLSFLVPRADLSRLRPVMDRLAAEVGARELTTDEGIAKVSLVGAGIKSHPKVLADTFAALAEEGINIEMISTSSVRVSCVIRAADADRAVVALHRRFDLANEIQAREEHTTATG
jgi:aspartate kinase